MPLVHILNIDDRFARLNLLVQRRPDSVPLVNPKSISFVKGEYYTLVGEVPCSMLFFSENSISSAASDTDFIFSAIGSTRQDVVALLRTCLEKKMIGSRLASDIQLVFQAGQLDMPREINILFERLKDEQVAFSRLWDSMLEKYPHFELYLFEKRLSLFSMSEIEEQGARLIEWFHESESSMDGDYNEFMERRRLEIEPQSSKDADCKEFMEKRLDLFKAEYALRDCCQKPEIVEGYLNALAVSLPLGCKGALIYTEFSSSNSSLYIWRKGDSGSPGLIILDSSFVRANPDKRINILKTKDGFTLLTEVCKREITLPTKASSAAPLYSGAKFFPGALDESFQPVSTTPAPADPDSTGGHASGPFRPVAPALASASSRTPVMPATVSVSPGTFVFGGQSSGAAGVAAASESGFSFQFTPSPASSAQKPPASGPSKSIGSGKTPEEFASFFAKQLPPAAAQPPADLNDVKPSA